MTPASRPSLKPPEAIPPLSRAETDHGRAEKRALLRGASVALGGFLVRPLSRVPLLILIGRLYGEAAFGRYVFAVGVFEALAAFARLGLKDTLFRFLAESPVDREGVLVDALVLSGGLALAAAVVVAIGAPLIGMAVGQPDLWAALASLAPVLPIFVLTDILLAATRAQRAVGYEVVARSLVEPAVLTLGVLLLGVTGMKGGLLAAYAVAQISALTVAVVGVARRYEWARRPRPDGSRIRRFAALSAPTGLADCMNLGFTAIGVVSVGHFLGAGALGVYGMAQNFETALSKIRQAFDMVVVPAASHWIACRSDGVVDQLRSVGRWILSAQLPLLGIFLLAGDLLLGLLGKGFSEGAAILSLLAVAAVIDGTANLAQVPLFLTRPTLHFLIALATLALHAGLSWVLVPRLGLVGTGFSMAAAWGMAGALRQLAVRRLLGRWLVDASLLKPAAAFFAGLVAAWAAMVLLPPTTSSRVTACLLFLSVYSALLVALEADLRRRLKAIAGRLPRR